MDFIIRTAEEGDAPGIAKVHVETWRSAYKGKMPAELLRDLSVEEKTAKWAKTIATKDPKKRLLVAVSTDTKDIVGFCMAGPSRDSNLPNFGEIAAIYVHPSAQGQGIGLDLMNAGLEYLREQDYTRAMLWVLDTNMETIGFYEAHGWIADGTEKKDIRKDGTVLEEVRYRIDL